MVNDAEISYSPLKWRPLVVWRAFFRNFTALWDIYFNIHIYMSINKVILVGNVGKDPVVRYFEKGVAKAAFPLATSETYTNQQGETITTTEWHNIVLWRALAEVAEKTVKKGTQLYIVGKIKTRSYVDKDGANKYITEILGDTMLVLDKKQAASSGNPDTGYNGMQDKAGGSKTVSEAQQDYRKPGAEQSKSQAGNNFSGPDDFTNGSAFDQGPIPMQNEDDLPF
jgi:single-strand DNA-binding protein